ncbi:MAG: pentapeptide repeat-containing protein, partial [Chloroflexi bacterium]
MVVFKEAFPLARSQNKGGPRSLDATGIQLDNAYLALADLKRVRMSKASLRKANLSSANLSSANLRG